LEFAGAIAKWRGKEPDQTAATKVIAGATEP